LDVKDDNEDNNQTNVNESNKETDETFGAQVEVEAFDDDALLEELINNNGSLKDLYDKRIQYRESQDQKLIEKLESIHQDDTLLEKMANERLVDGLDNDEVEIQNPSSQVNNRKKGFFEVLSSFIHNDEWLKKTDVCCWWCCHTFDTIPIGFPIEYHSTVRKFKVRGVFCSFACINAYKKERQIQGKDYLITFLHKKLTGESMPENTCAPPRCCLKMFGGDLTIEEFRSSCTDKIYKMIEYPMIIINDYVEEIEIANIKSINKMIFKEDTRNTMSSNDSDKKRIEDAKLRISKIEKATVTTGNTIEEFIKFG
jgi:hypothetical protein